MVWSAIASFGAKVLQGAKGIKGVASVAGQTSRPVFSSGGVRQGVQAFRDSARVQWNLAGPAGQSAMKTTAVTAAAIPVAHGFLNSGSPAPQGAGRY